MNDQKVQVTLNLVNGLLGYLGSRPYVEVADLIMALREQVQGRQASLRTHGQDDYRRTLGTVYVAGLDINAALVAQGHAWAWRDSRGRSPYLKQEAAARAAGRGAHASQGAEPPWEFRHRHGRCRG